MPTEAGRQCWPTRFVRPRPASELAALACLAALVLTGCTNAGSGGSGTGTSAATSSGSTATDPAASPDSSTEPGSPSGSVAPPLPNPAPSTIPKVTRGGTATPTATAPISPFAAPANYPDGVVVTVVKAAKAIETGQGPGVFNGRELVVVDLEIANGSTAPLGLDQVVVTTYYGLAKQLAPVVYPGNIEVKDFGGTAGPGAKLTARYAFAVPAADLGAVTMVVDFDEAHASAIFTGSVVT